MPKLSIIYGIDENDFAQGIAADALKNTAGTEDVWGGAIDQGDRSHGNKPFGGKQEPGDSKRVDSTGSLGPKKSEGN